jgi:hypothetical protein
MEDSATILTVALENPRTAVDQESTKNGAQHEVNMSQCFIKVYKGLFTTGLWQMFWGSKAPII